MVINFTKLLNLNFIKDKVTFLITLQFRKLINNSLKLPK